MRLPRLLPAALLAALLVAPAAPAAAAPPELTGVVHLGGGVRAGVRVAWYEPGSGVLTSTTTRADGRFALPAPPAGTRYLIATNVTAVRTEPRAALPDFLATWTGAGDDDRPAAALVEPAVADGGDRDVDIAVQRAVRITGAHRAFADLPVRLLTLGGRTAATTRASRSGAWSFRAAPGRYRIGAYGDERWLPSVSKAFTAVGADPVVVRSAPRRAGAIAGRLTWRGEPAKGVRVRLEGPVAFEDIEEDPVRTDADGRFRFRGLVPGRVTVRFGNAGDGGDRGRFVQTSRVRTVRSGATTVVDAALTRGATLTGRLTRPSGAKQAVLQVRRGGPTGALVRTTTLPLSKRTVRNGFEQFGLPAGRYTVQLVGDDGRRSASREVHLRPGRTTALGTVRATRPALAISGRGPVGADVFVSEGVLFRRTVVGADGTYRVDGLVPGRYRVLTQTAGTEQSEVRRTLTRSTTLDVATGPATALRTGTLRARIAAGGVPVPLVGLEIDGGEKLLVTDGVLDREGFPAGEHRVTAVEVYGERLFATGTPYDLAWPGTGIVVPADGVADLGTVALDVIG